MLKVSRQPQGQPEIFHSLQGEGVNIGMPCVFLRLALCNLRCSWCDTKYTWDWKHYQYDQEVLDMEPEAVEQCILAYNCHHLVLTGGEPTLQATQAVPLLQSLRQRGFFIEVETNGTILPEQEFSALVNQWNVSPKLNNSGNSPQRREVSRALAYFAGLAHAYFKYVIDNPEDLAEVLRLNENYAIPAARTLLMPQATDPAELSRKSVWLTELCKENGFRFSNRLHILLWGDSRGI
ncbi:MAG: 7-carboxy-7-deazaguanine synthase QueE [Dehalococcoidia bacterium]